MRIFKNLLIKETETAYIMCYGKQNVIINKSIVFEAKRTVGRMRYITILDEHADEFNLYLQALEIVEKQEIQARKQEQAYLAKKYEDGIYEFTRECRIKE